MHLLQILFLVLWVIGPIPMQSKRPAVLLFKRRTSTPLMKMGRYFLDARSRFWFWTEFSLGCRRIILFKNDTYKTSGTYVRGRWQVVPISMHYFSYYFSTTFDIPRYLIFLRGGTYVCLCSIPLSRSDKLMIFSLGGDLTFTITTCWRISTYLTMLLAWIISFNFYQESSLLQMLHPSVDYCWRPQLLDIPEEPVHNLLG